MTKEKQTIVSGYVKEVASNLICPGYAKRQTLKMISAEISAFAENNPSFSKDDLYNELGSPKQYAKNLFDKDDYCTILKHEKKKAKIIAIVGIAVIVVAIVALAIIIYFATRTVYITG